VKNVKLKLFFLLLSSAIIFIILFYSISAYYAYFFPMKYQEKIEILSDKYDVSGAIVASIANVESNFNEKAVSNKGALGVMQLMPSTAEWLAEKTGIEYDKEKLFDGEYCLELGAYYISFLIDFFDDERLAICAYNAGQGNVSYWLTNKQYSSDGKTLDYIPFEETRNYLAKVLNQYNYYKNKYK